MIILTTRSVRKYVLPVFMLSVKDWQFHIVSLKTELPDFDSIYIGRLQILSNCKRIYVFFTPISQKLYFITVDLW